MIFSYRLIRDNSNLEICYYIVSNFMTDIDKNKLQDINGIGFTLLDSSDVLRHKLVKKILDKYKK